MYSNDVWHGTCGMAFIIILTEFSLNQKFNYNKKINNHGTCGMANIAWHKFLVQFLPIFFDKDLLVRAIEESIIFSSDHFNHTSEQLQPKKKF